MNLTALFLIGTGALVVIVIWNWKSVERRKQEKLLQQKDEESKLMKEITTYAEKIKTSDRYSNVDKHQCKQIVSGRLPLEVKKNLLRSIASNQGLTPC